MHLLRFAQRSGLPWASSAQTVRCLSGEPCSACQAQGDRAPARDTRLLVAGCVPDRREAAFDQMPVEQRDYLVRDRRASGNALHRQG